MFPCRRLDTMGLGPIFNLSAWDSVARQAMIRCAALCPVLPLPLSGNGCRNSPQVLSP